MSRYRMWVVAAAVVAAAPAMADAQKGKPKPGGAVTATIAYEGRRPNGWYDLMVMDANGGNQTRLVSGGDNMTPAWSPDGEWIAFARTGIAAPGIYMIRRNGTGLCRVVATTGGHLYGAPAWSPFVDAGGRHTLVYVDRNAGELRPDLFAVTAMCNAGTRQVLTQTPESYDAWPAFSPSGQLAAYIQGDIHVFDVAVGAGGLSIGVGVNLTSTGPLAGSDVYGPAWTADGRELLVSGAAELWMISAAIPGQAQPLTQSSTMLERRATWSADRTKIAFDATGDLYVADITQFPWLVGEPRLLLGGGGAVGHPAWRPVN